MAKLSRVTFKSNRVAVTGAIRKGALKGVQGATLDLLRRSVQLAPVDEGDLRGSASATVNDQEVGRGKPDGGVQANAGLPNVKGGEVEGIVGFAEPYSLQQHEDMSLNHPRGGEAKFLENPATENERRYRNFIRKAIREETE